MGSGTVVAARACALQLGPVTEHGVSSRVLGELAVGCGDSRAQVFPHPGWSVEDCGSCQGIAYVTHTHLLPEFPRSRKAQAHAAAGQLGALSPSSPTASPHKCRLQPGHSRE
ncbi:hypothetical protein P7K49_023213 [Saguinus oedipus]|uniref:Uncharacterized protein n=1 Tax=Saguinus oedipus TaxID=9490 RepID=A0ABQ9UNB1_SAGOE|nr:hypothetical protein P7K49_023213 [Saguinus oedipus]